MLFHAGVTEVKMQGELPSSESGADSYHPIVFFVVFNVAVVRHRLVERERERKKNNDIDLIPSVKHFPNIIQGTHDCIQHAYRKGREEEMERAMEGESVSSFSLPRDWGV